jgi:hypothetical protein
MDYCEFRGNLGWIRQTPCYYGAFGEIVALPKRLLAFSRQSITIRSIMKIRSSIEDARLAGTDNRAAKKIPHGNRFEGCLACCEVSPKGLGEVAPLVRTVFFDF